ncbi:hypothetical protein M0209_16685 [Sphingomonas sp. SUN039]|nr:hypothetical protein M0209_16685 [Sphingomonas sp. SUN039]
MGKLLRAGFALFAPLILWACVLTPGKFVSSLTVNADRTFAFAYKGEVIALDPGGAMKGFGKREESKDAQATDDTDKAAKEKAGVASAAEADAKNREIAAALSNEAGYKSVVYRGNGKFDIDYAISGSLTHSFLFPFNADAQAVLPFLMVEVRQGGTVRLRAPGFANSDSGTAAMNPMGGGVADAAKYLDGVFTLDTDAEIISQNNEDGAKAVGRRKQIVWRATPLTKDAPTAVLRLK